MIKGNKRDRIEVSLILFIVLLIVIIFHTPNINAGPYGYGNSMDLKYHVSDGKIVYGYGEGTKYKTSLKPKDVNWSEWIPESRREVVDLSWDEIFGKVKSDNISEIKQSDNITIDPLVIDKLENQTEVYYKFERWEEFVGGD